MTTKRSTAVPIKMMDKDQLIYLLRDILEKNHQSCGERGRCPWCNAPEYPTDEEGHPVNDADDAAEFAVDHASHCAVSMIEDAFAGQYEYYAPPADTKQAPGGWAAEQIEEGGE